MSDLACKNINVLDETLCRLCFQTIHDVNCELSCGHNEFCAHCLTGVSVCPTCGDTLFITIKLKTLDGIMYRVQCDPHETADNICKRFARLLDVPNNIGLLYGGRMLTSDATLAGRMIPHNAIIHVLEHLRGD